MFYEKKTKRAWFSSTSSEVCWEQWAITIDVVTNIHEKGRRSKNVRRSGPACASRLKLTRVHNHGRLLDRQRSIKNMEKALSARFLSILRTVNERKDHIPPITTSEGNPFPYQIVIPTAADTWGSMFKRMLDTSASLSSSPAN